MSSYAEIVALVEGSTEKIFIQDIVAPYLAAKGIYMTPIIISKPGQKGGDVKFARVKNDIGLHLKQRPDTYLTLLVDYYGMKKDWPGFQAAKKQSTAAAKADKINRATTEDVCRLFDECEAPRRFIPYVAMHEFEALLFSEAKILAAQLRVPVADINKILRPFPTPEEINDSPNTAPSKRLIALSDRFKKTTTGIAVARAIGLQKIREACPLFNMWMASIEKLREA